MASIIKRGKTYSVVHYEGRGKDRHQVWESGLSYTAARSRKAQIEHEEKEKNKDEGKDHEEINEITVSEFIYEFIDKYGTKKWVASTYDGNVGLLENYVHPLILIAIGCTIREGEIGGLQWKNVNFDKLQFRIDRTIDRVKKKI